MVNNTTGSGALDDLTGTRGDVSAEKVWQGCLPGPLLDLQGSYVLISTTLSQLSLIQNTLGQYCSRRKCYSHIIEMELTMNLDLIVFYF